MSMPNKRRKVTLDIIIVAVMSSIVAIASLIKRDDQ